MTSRPTISKISFWRRRNAFNPPAFLKFRSSSTFILVTICIAVFSDIFLYSVIVPVIPFALRDRVGIPEEEVQHWVSVLLAVYGAALLVGSPIFGLVADRTPNRRLPLLVGLLALAGSTLLLCLGRTLALLMIGRILQGLSAGVVWTVGLALLADTVGHETIGQAMGYVSISMSFGILVAPLIGGVVYDTVGYYPVYYIAFGMIILDIFLRFALVEKKVARKWLEEENRRAAEEDEEKAEVQGSPASSHSAISLQRMTTTMTRSTTPTPSVKKKTKNAISLLLSSRRLLAALVCTMIQSSLLTAWDAVLPLFVNGLFGWSSLGGGLIFLPLILPTLSSPLIGYWSDKKGPRWPTALGFLSAAPFLILLRFVDHYDTKQVVLLCALLAFLGFAITNAMTPLLAEITYVVSHKEQTHAAAFGGKGAYSTAYGLFSSSYAAGMLVGPIWGGLVNQHAGWGTMCWSLALLSLFGAVTAFVFAGGEIWKVRKLRRQSQAVQNIET